MKYVLIVFVVVISSCWSVFAQPGDVIDRFKVELQSLQDAQVEQQRLDFAIRTGQRAEELIALPVGGMLEARQARIVAVVLNGELSGYTTANEAGYWYFYHRRAEWLDAVRAGKFDVESYSYLTVDELCHYWQLFDDSVLLSLQSQKLQKKRSKKRAVYLQQVEDVFASHSMLFDTLAVAVNLEALAVKMLNRSAIELQLGCRTMRWPSLYYFDGVDVARRPYPGTVGQLAHMALSNTIVVELNEIVAQHVVERPEQYVLAFNVVVDNEVGWDYSLATVRSRIRTVNVTLQHVDGSVVTELPAN